MMPGKIYVSFLNTQLKERKFILCLILAASMIIHDKTYGRQQKSFEILT